MKKRVISVLLILILLCSVLPITSAAVDGLSYFNRVNTYQSGRFTDIATSDWYAAYVQAAYEYDLINGKTDKTFEPESSLTVAEAIKLAACIHSIYYTGSANFSNAELWYEPYVAYALENGIIDEAYSDYGAAATRADFAMILAGALPAEALAAKNTVEASAVPDVPMDASYCDAVYLLYRAGVLTGSGQTRVFLPNSTIKRSEASAVVVRMVNASFRQGLTLTAKLTAQEIYDKCSPAVFYIKIYDIKDTAIKTGSGFFIDGNGMAVTNYHVISGAARAVITTYDGEEYEVSGVYDTDKINDLALIQVDGSGFSYLEMGDSDAIKTGADAYAIGSPLGFKNTFSQGIISSASRVILGVDCIQTTAAISSGSSGGALLDNTGKVIGVTTMTAVDAQNINIAVPINMVGALDDSKPVTLASILPDTKYYKDYYPVPDFGAFAGASVYKTENILGETFYYYRADDLSMPVEGALGEYAQLLEENTFQLYGYAVADGGIITYYINSAYNLLVSFGLTEIDGVECVEISIIPAS